MKNEKQPEPVFVSEVRKMMDERLHLMGVPMSVWFNNFALFRMGTAMEHGVLVNDDGSITSFIALKDEVGNVILSEKKTMDPLTSKHEKAAMWAMQDASDLCTLFVGSILQAAVEFGRDRINNTETPK